MPLEKLIQATCSSIFSKFYKDDKLKELVDQYSGSYPDWAYIAQQFADRTDIQCQHRWQKVLSPDLIKGPWTKEVFTQISL